MPKANIKNKRAAIIAVGYFFKIEGSSLTAPDVSQQRMKTIQQRAKPDVDS
ncbi:MAG: hypothetical protein GQ541_08290 [Desulfovibrionaceae bacterium]|nr:hypothetical protein [Desulfovibrionaceae bacterium]